VQGVAVTGRPTVYLIGVTDVSLLRANGVGKLLAGSGLVDAGDGGPAGKAKFFASQAAVDPAGNVYVAGNDAHRVRKFAPRGMIGTFAGNGRAGFGGDGGPASQAQLNRPEYCSRCRGKCLHRRYRQFSHAAGRHRRCDHHDCRQRRK
jgi:hypothetical protein